MKYNRLKKNIRILYLPILGLFSLVGNAQIPIERQSIITASEKFIFSDPNEAIRIAIQLLKNENNSNADIAKINLVLAKSYKVKGDYSNALKILFEEKKYNFYLTDFEKNEVSLNKIEILSDLSLNDESEKLLKLVDIKVPGSITNKSNSYIEKLLLLEKTKLLLNDRKIEQGIQLLKGEQNKSIEIFKIYPELKLWYTIKLGEFYLEKKNLIAAKEYYTEALKIITNQKKENTYAKIYALSGLADVFFYQKQHNEVTDLLNYAFVYSKKIQNVFLQEKILQKQTINYLALNKISEYKSSHAKYTQVLSRSETLEQEAVNTAYNLIAKEKNQKYLEHKNQNNFIIKNIVFFFLIILIIFIFFWQRVSIKVKNLKQLINYLQITKNNWITLYSDQGKESEPKQESKKIIILKETEDLILQKLKRFENSKKFLNKDISLAVLAGQFDTNTKYLSEIINSHYQINFNSYINNLRINYIVMKLKTDPNYKKYKISHLAESCGFSSHSSFATVFKSITGISPVKFIDFLNNEKNNSLDV
jgi:AraC-like DNA-binding protein